jgi:hypothetical protein
MQPNEVVLTAEFGDPTVAARAGTRVPVQVGHLPTDVTLVTVDPSEVIVVPQR